MNRPFTIFPKVGYRNCQFQVYNNKRCLHINIYYRKCLLKTIITNKTDVVIIENFVYAGLYTAKCEYNNLYYEQEIEVLDAFRLGSSEFKSAFVFENSDYSFILMNDRLLLYSEADDLILTENNYSPTSISLINQHNYLFITTFIDGNDRIDNVCIYNTESFSIVNELVNSYKLIYSSCACSVIWMFSKLNNSIHCYELINIDGNTFSEIIQYTNIIKYEFILDTSWLYIESNRDIVFVDLNNKHESIRINLSNNIAVDCYGNVIKLHAGMLSINNYIMDYSSDTIYINNLYLDRSKYIYVGILLMRTAEFTCAQKIFEVIEPSISNALCSHTKAYYYHRLTDSELYQEKLIHHNLYPSVNGVYIHIETKKRIIRGVKCKYIDGKWYKRLDVELLSNNNLKYFEMNNSVSLLDNLQISSRHIYIQYGLIVRSADRCILLRDKQRIDFPCSAVFDYISVEGNHYLLVNNDASYSLYNLASLPQPVLENVDIHNYKYIDQHKVIWHSSTNTTEVSNPQISAYDLASNKELKFELNERQSIVDDCSKLNFTKNYIQSSNGYTIDPKNACIHLHNGEIHSRSECWSKIVSHRDNRVYLSIINSGSKAYNSIELNLYIDVYKKSHLSPCGRYLVLMDKCNEYRLHDIVENRTVKYLTGKFISYNREGKLIIETTLENQYRAVKIFDPITFSDVTPDNYKYYKFTSPDGRLYANVLIETSYINRITGSVMSAIEAAELRRVLCSNVNFSNDLTAARIISIMLDLYDSNTEYFNKQHVFAYQDIKYDQVVKIQKFTKIGVVGTSITADINFPNDIAYYNYASFSFDNKYLACVGKPGHKGLILLYKINFNEHNNDLKIVSHYAYNIPEFASWVCGFSKSGYFATYDSKPNTYICYVDDTIFRERRCEIESSNLLPDLSNKKFSNELWKIISNKNFLCFSPSGRYMALSEQGYDPLTLGGYGHQESNAVHIIITKSRKYIDSFTGHGCKSMLGKNILVAAFSDDESLIMTLSADGVVIVRAINISNVSI